MEKRISLKDIASKAGVSIATVSYVLNEKEKEKHIRKEVVEKINKAAKELNYQPNQIARSLRKKTTKTIGMIVADIANPFFSQMARIVENTATAHGYTLIFGSSDEDPHKSEALINSLSNRQVDGFIIVPTEGADEQIKALLRRKMPLVLVDRYFPKISTNRVVLDNYQATYDATMHLIQQNVKNITFVAYTSKLIHMRERIRGYQEAMTVSGLAENVSVEEINYGPDHEAEMEKCLNKILSKRIIPQGLIFATNALSVSGLFYIRKNCLKIPEDIAFIGFDGGDSFDLFQPPLSYVQQPLEGIGKETFNLLMELLNGSKKTAQIMLNPSLIIRDNKKC